MIVLCAWHQQYWGKNDVYSNHVDQEWRSITPVVSEMIAKQAGEISHGLCPDCHKRLDEEIEFENKRKEFLNGGNGRRVLRPKRA